tara:strand:+ start:2223 stop:3173 length:951 start_codon:yes stop_codon:yes gene_type:complete
MIFKKNNPFYLTITTFFSLIIVSCSVDLDEDYTKKTGDKPLVLTTFTVLADMAKNVAGDRLFVDSITKPGAEIHGYQPTPSDLVKASKADLIIENGFGLERWINKFTAAAGEDVPTVVLTKGMNPILIEGDIYSGKPNPHAWMSPRRALIYVDNIINAFIDLDPESEQYYRQNGETYKKKLMLLDKELKRSISLIPQGRRVLVSCEGAFTYLANDYGLEEAYLWPVNSESQVTPRRMQNLIEKIKEKNIQSIFCESTVSSKPQREVAKASGARFGGTFYVDSLSKVDGPASSLLNLQRHNVRLIQKGLIPINSTGN